MNRPALWREIDTLVPEPYEFDVKSTWHTILDQYFPASASYMVRDKTPNEFGIADIILYEHRSTNGSDTYF